MIMFRALCSITDATMLQSIERYMKQAIVDNMPSIASAALVSSLHIAGAGNPNASPGRECLHPFYLTCLSKLSPLRALWFGLGTTHYPGFGYPCLGSRIVDDS